MILKASLEKLVCLASDPIDPRGPLLTADVVVAAGSLAEELYDVLKTRNGFYAFEGALHLLPAQSVEGEMGISEWNEAQGWKGEYGDLAEGLLFFAEDVFGGQFAISKDCVVTFDPETAETAIIGRSLDEWARALLDDYKMLTGHPLAAEWQRQNGRLVAGERLMPRIPFVCGGEFKIENLVAIDAREGMKARGNLARRVHDLPDGAKIQLKIE